MAGTIDNFSSDLDLIPNTDVDADSPLDTTLITELRDQIEFIQRWLGKSGIDNAIADHAHAGFTEDGSSPIVGASGGTFMALQTSAAEEQSFMRINFLAEVSFTWPVAGGGSGGTFGGVRHKDMVGFVSKPLDLNNLSSQNILEQLHGGSRIFGGYADGALKEVLSLKSQAGILNIGTYDGDGATSHPISGIGFKPEAVYIAPKVTHPSDPIIKTKSFIEGAQGTGESRATNGNLITNGILTFDADGFTLGNATGVNNGTISYFYIAWKTGTSAGEKVAVVSFAGDGTDDRDITDVQLTPTLDFTPDVIFAVNATGNASQLPGIKTRSMGLNTKGMSGINSVANGIQRIRVNGVEVGTLARFNENTETIDLICMKGGTFRW